MTRYDQEGNFDLKLIVIILPPLSDDDDAKIRTSWSYWPTLPGRSLSLRCFFLKQVIFTTTEGISCSPFPLFFLTTKKKETFPLFLSWNVYVIFSTLLVAVWNNFRKQEIHRVVQKSFFSQLGGGLYQVESGACQSLAPSLELVWRGWVKDWPAKIYKRKIKRYSKVSFLFLLVRSLINPFPWKSQTLDCPNCA